MAYLDPTTIRLSENFLLSDFMGCSSVYGLGYPNRFDASWGEKLREGALLAEKLDQICDRHGAISVCYGFISPDLSRKIVTYQSPDKPSFHRWDLGAAADICLHEYVAEHAPVFAAFDIDNEVEHSRLITYSESEWLCFGTKKSEKDTGMARKLYENRFTGVKKPTFIRYSDNPEVRAAAKDYLVLHKAQELDDTWRGQGWPSYHGGGRRQYEHHRVSRFSVMTDFLYDRFLVQRGIPNSPPFEDESAMIMWMRCARGAGAVIDSIATKFNSRVSVIRAYNRTVEKQNWTRRYTLELATPTHQDAYHIANYLEKQPGVLVARVNDKTHRISVTGEPA